MKTEDYLNCNFERVVHNRMPTVLDMDVPLDDFTHYSRPDARDCRTIFGRKDDSLSYVYDDRLQMWDYTKDQDAKVYAATVAKKSTARYYQEFLQHYYGKPVELKHIMAGCNVSNGFGYLVFGFKEPL